MSDVSKLYWNLNNESYVGLSLLKQNIVVNYLIFFKQKNSILLEKKIFLSSSNKTNLFLQNLHKLIKIYFS